MFLKHKIKSLLFDKCVKIYKGSYKNNILAISIFTLTIILISFSKFSNDDPLNQEQRNWINNKNSEIILNNVDYAPPLLFKNNYGKETGIALDFFKLIEKKLRFKFKYEQTDTWPNIKEKILNKKIDVINRVESNDKFSKAFIYTKSYIDIPIVIVTRREITKQLKLPDLVDRKVLICQNNTFFKKLNSRYPNLDIIAVSDVEQSILEVSTKGADAVIVNVAFATHLIEKNKISNLRIAGYTDQTYSLKFAVSRDNIILKEILDKGIELITSSEKKRIYKKWFFQEPLPIFKTKVFSLALGLTVFCMISVLILMVISIYKLKKAIETQKLQLQKEITKREKTAKKLLEKKTHLRSLLQTIPDLVWLKNTKGEYLNCNENFEKLHGITLKEIAGKTDHDFLDTNIANSLQKSDIASLESESLVIIEDIFSYPNETKEKVFETIKTPVYDSNNKKVGILGISRNITKRKKVEKELIDKNALLESLLSNIRGITYRCLPNKDWDMIYLSNYIKVMTGYERDDFLNNSMISYGSIIHPDDRNSVFSIVNRSIENFSDWEIEYRIVKKNNEICWVFEKGYASLNPKGNIEYLDGFIIDINDKKIMEQKLMQSQKMEAIGTLSSGIVHDFNNILSGIMGFTELLHDELQTLENKGKMLKWIEYINKGGIRARELISQILTFSRHQAQMNKPMRITSIVKEISKLLRSTLNPKITIIEQYRSDSLVLINPTNLYQLIMNLCTNAGYAMKDIGGKLIINISDRYLNKEDICDDQNASPGKFVCISIEDTGVGIDKEIIDKIMTPFYTTKPSGSGTGIGLWVVQGIVDKMKGVIKVSSLPGKGSKFRVYLPVFEKIPVVENSDKKIRPQLRNERIMFIDDEESLLQLARILLGQLGYSVTTFENGNKAMEEYKKNHMDYDLVITDMNMPGISGQEVAMLVKNINPNAKIILSTGTDITHESDSKLKLFDSLIDKPFEINKITKEIEKILEKTDRGY